MKLPSKMGDNAPNNVSGMRKLQLIEKCIVMIKTWKNCLQENFVLI